MSHHFSFLFSLFLIIKIPALQFPHFVYQQSFFALQFTRRNDLSCWIFLFIIADDGVSSVSISLCSFRFFLLSCSTASRLCWFAIRRNRFQNPTTHALRVVAVVVAACCTCSSPPLPLSTTSLLRIVLSALLLFSQCHRCGETGDPSGTWSRSS